MHILVINGPNINLLGQREPELYGETSYDEFIEELTDYAQKQGLLITAMQTNHEGDIVDNLQAAPASFDAVILNPAAFTHYSVAIRDAITALRIPVVTVHFTDITQREAFRKQDLMVDVAAAQFSGFGIGSYFKAVDYLAGLAA